MADSASDEDSHSEDEGYPQYAFWSSAENGNLKRYSDNFDFKCDVEVDDILNGYLTDEKLTSYFSLGAMKHQDPKQLIEKLSLKLDKNTPEAAVILNKAKNICSSTYLMMLECVIRNVLEDQIVSKKCTALVKHLRKNEMDVARLFAAFAGEVKAFNEANYDRFVNQLKTYASELISNFISSDAEERVRQSICEWFDSGEMNMNNRDLWRKWMESRGSLNDLRQIRWSSPCQTDYCYHVFLNDLKKVTNDDFMYPKYIRRDLKKLLRKPKLTKEQIKSGMKNAVILEYSARTIFLSEIVQEIRQIAKHGTDNAILVEVRFFPFTVFNIDSELNLPGINIVVVSKKVKIWGNQKIDLSGKSYHKNVFPKLDRSGENKDGKDGSSGTPGESSGNILISAEEMVNKSSLRLYLNGGHGQRGQNGGDAGDGSDGHSMLLSEFDQMRVQYGSIYWTAWSHFYNYTPPKNWVNDVRKIDKTNEYIYEEYKDDLGRRMIYSCSALKPHWYSATTYYLYIIVHGTEGKMGGAGGLGGNGGSGGNAGECILFNTLTGDSFDVVKEQNPGKTGDNGKDGQSGEHGTNGREIAMIDKSVSGGAKCYYGMNDPCKLTYRTFCGDDDYRRFSGYHCHYHGQSDNFVKIESGSVNTGSSSQKAKKNENQREKSRDTEAKKSISVEKMMEKAQKVFEQQKCTMTVVAESKLAQQEQEETEKEQEETVEEEVTVIKDRDDNNWDLDKLKVKKLTGEQYYKRVIEGKVKGVSRIAQDMIDLFNVELTKEQFDYLNILHLKLMPIRYQRLIKDTFAFALVVATQSKRRDGMNIAALRNLAQTYTEKLQEKQKHVNWFDSFNKKANAYTDAFDGTIDETVVDVDKHLLMVKPTAVQTKLANSDEVRRVVNSFYKGTTMNTMKPSLSKTVYKPWKALHNLMKNESVILKEFKQEDNFDWSDNVLRHRILGKYFPEASKSVFEQAKQAAKDKAKKAKEKLSSTAAAFSEKVTSSKTTEGKSEKEGATESVPEPEETPQEDDEEKRIDALQMPDEPTTPVDPLVSQSIRNFQQTIALNVKELETAFQDWQKLVADSDSASDMIIRFGKVPKFSSNPTKNEEPAAFLIRFYFQILQSFTFQMHAFQILKMSNERHIPSKTSQLFEDKSGDNQFYTALTEMGKNQVDITSGKPLQVMRDVGLDCAMYRYLAAYMCDVNIRLYGDENYNDYRLLESFNPSASTKLYLMTVDGKTVSEPVAHMDLRKIRSKKNKLVGDEAFVELKKEVDAMSVDFSTTTMLTSILAKYFDKEYEDQVNEWIEKYLAVVKDQSFLNLLLKRFQLDGNHLSLLHFQFILNTSMYLVSNCKESPQFIFNFASGVKQSMMVVAFLVLKMESKWFFKLGDSEFYGCVQAMAQVPNVDMLVLFGTKIEDPIAADVLIKVFTMLQHTSDMSLEKMQLKDWIDIAEHQQWSVMGDKLEEYGPIGYYFAFLDHCKCPFLEKFQKIFDGFNKVYIPEMLMARLTYLIANNEVNVDASYLDNVRHCLQRVSSYIEDNVDDFDELLEHPPDEKIVVVCNEADQMKALNHVNFDFELVIPNKPRNLDELHQLIRHQTGDNAVPAEALDQFVADLADEEHETTKWLREIDVVLKEKRGVTLRNTQKLAIMAVVNGDQNTLAQVNTGEGKSYIIASIAIIRAKQFNTVDVITSSSVLAARDCEEMSEIYEAFGLTAGHICDEDMEKRKLAYKCNIIYGDIGRFQRDYLLHTFYKKNIRGDRENHAVIVDEVDNMMLDNGSNMLYLSHQVPGLETLQSLFVFIHKIVNMPMMDTELKQADLEKKFETETIKKQVITDLKGLLEMEDLRHGIHAKDESFILRIWDKLTELKIIEKSGYLIDDQLLPAQIPTIEKELKAFAAEYIVLHTVNCLKVIASRNKEISVPRYLHEFCVLHLDEFVDNAKRAMFLKHNVEYVVDLDHTKQDSDLMPKIIIIDQNTGVDLATSQWSEGLHQLVQLKHGCRVLPITLKAVFISNVAYLKKYTKINGLSGTLGSTEESRTLAGLYDAQLIRIPTSKPKAFYEHIPVICESESQWARAIYDEVKDQAFAERSVLVVCESIEKVLSLEKQFVDIYEKDEDHKKLEKMKTFEKMIIYQRESDEIDFSSASALDSCVLIISTNLAGRGTDIKLSPELEKAGGLHVIVSFLPDNKRIEDQAYGRAARCGKPGSGQIIVHIENEEENPSIFQLKEIRDNKEVHRIKSLKDFYQYHTVIEEQCLEKFKEHSSNAFSSLTQAAANSKLPSIEQIVYFALLDEWALWLDQQTPLVNQCSNEHDDSIKETIIDSVSDFLKAHPMKLIEEALKWIKAPQPLLYAAIVYIENGKTPQAMALLDRIGSEFVEFIGEALYFRGVIEQRQIRTAAKLPEDPKILQGLVDKTVEEKTEKEKKEGFLASVNTRLDKRVDHVSAEFKEGNYVNGAWEFTKFTLDMCTLGGTNKLGQGMQWVANGTVDLINLGLSKASEGINELTSGINADWLMDCMVNIDEEKRSNTEEFFHHARHRIEFKKHQQKEATKIVGVIQQAGGPRSIKVEGFAEQTRQTSKLINVIMDNIDDMVGSVMSEEKLNFDSDKFEAFKRFRAFKSQGFINPPVLCLNTIPHQYDVFRKKYYISRVEFKNAIEGARSSVFREDFRGRTVMDVETLKEWIKLPSREDFWTQLKRKNCFEKQFTCFRVDRLQIHEIEFLDKLEQVNWAELLPSKATLVTLSNSDFNDVHVRESFYTYESIMKLAADAAYHDKIDYLLSREVIIPDKIGILNVMNLTNLTFFENFDGVTAHALSLYLEVDEKFAAKILQQFVENGIFEKTFMNIALLNVDFEAEDIDVEDGLKLPKELVRRLKDYKHLRSISIDVLQILFKLKDLHEIVKVFRVLVDKKILVPKKEVIYVQRLTLDCSFLPPSLKEVELFLIHNCSYTSAFKCLEDSLLKSLEKSETVKTLFLPLDPYKDLHKDMVKYGIIMPPRIDPFEEMFIDYGTMDKGTELKKVVDKHKMMLTETKAKMTATPLYLEEKQVTLPLDVKNVVTNNVKQVATIEENTAWKWWLALAIIVVAVVVVLAVGWFLGPAALVIAAKIALFALTVLAAVGTVAYFVQNYMAQKKTYTVNDRPEEQFSVMLEYHKQAEKQFEEDKSRALLELAIDEQLKDISTRFLSQFTTHMKLNSVLTASLTTICQKYKVDDDTFKSVCDNLFVGTIYKRKIVQIVETAAKTAHLALCGALIQLISANIKNKEFNVQNIIKEVKQRKNEVNFVDKNAVLMIEYYLQRILHNFEQSLKTNSEKSAQSKDVDVNKRAETLKSMISEAFQQTTHRTASKWIYEDSKRYINKFIRFAQLTEVSGCMSDYVARQRDQKEILQQRSILVSASRNIWFIVKDAEDILRQCFVKTGDLNVLKHMITFNHLLPLKSAQLITETVAAVVCNVDKRVPRNWLNVRFNNKGKLVVECINKDQKSALITLNMTLLDGGFYVTDMDESNGKKKKETSMGMYCIFDQLSDQVKAKKMSDVSIFDKQTFRNLVVEHLSGKESHATKWHQSPEFYEF